MLAELDLVRDNSEVNMLGVADLGVYFAVKKWLMFLLSNEAMFLLSMMAF